MTSNLPATIDTPTLALAPPSTPAWVEMLTPVADLARQIAGTDFVPESMRGKPAAVAAAILFGAELGLPPMQSLAKIDIVKGRPAPRAELARALALAAGHEVWVDESTNTRVKVSGRRRGTDVVQSVTWTLDDAKRAGIASAMYSRYPRQMLLARASAELIRQMAPDVLGGIAVFAEEADDAPAAAPAASHPATAAGAPATTRRRRASTPPAEPEQSPPEPPATEPEPDPTAPADPASDAQIKRMMVGFNAIGIKAREDRLAFIAAAATAVDSSRDLTKAEAARVIDALDAVAQGRLTIDHTDGALALTPAEPVQRADAADAASGEEDLPPLPDEDPEDWS